MQRERFVPLLCTLLAAASCGAPAEHTAAPARLPAITDSEAEEWAATTLAGLTLEQKVGQMICEQMRGDVPAAGPDCDALVALVRDHGLGAFVVYGGSPVETAKLLDRLQREAEIPLLITSDFEGGPGQQFAGATEFPANMALAAIGSEDIAYRCGKVGAREGRAIGIHVTYSPVVDIQTDPGNPVLGVRSFGGDLALGGRMAGAYIRGYQEHGMLATAKHYPGRGEVTVIPGTRFTVNDKPAAAVLAEDLLAFRQAIEAGVAYIMTEHIAVPALADGSDLPASVEQKLVGGWLRDELGFAGVITSDDMWYDKVVDRFGAVRACVMAIQAGHDAILKPADAVATIQGIVEAVNAGEIPVAQIDRSVRRILFYKAKLGLHRERFVDLAAIPSRVATPEHLALRDEVADASLTMLINRGFFPHDPAKLGRIVHVSIQRSPSFEAPRVVAAKLDAAFPGTRHVLVGADGAAEDVRAQALAAVADADTVLVSLFNPRRAYVDNGPLGREDAELVAAICARHPDATIVTSYGNPYVVQSVPDATVFLVGYGEGGFYGNQTIYADSLIRLLRGEIRTRGKLPVAASADHPIGSGITF